MMAHHKSGDRLAFIVTVVLYALALAAAFVATNARAQSLLNPEYTEFYGSAGGEVNLFFEEPRFPGQDNHNISIFLEPTFYAEWEDGDLSATFTPFARLDSGDSERTHFDIRELKLDYVSGDWEFTVGVDTVFWGKTEAARVVDIINQTDILEDLDEEDSLGQPMIRVGRQFDFGTVQAFYLPYFRKRQFPGDGGRLRAGLPVEESLERIDVNGGRFAPSFALRYDGVFGGADIGLSAFHGVSRDPGFEPVIALSSVPGAQPQVVGLAPIYDRISQIGFDGQFTDDATLYKAEAIYRTGQTNLNGNERDYVAASGGIEHTLYQVFDNADLGLIAEYAWDSRGRDATTTFNNDVILGARLALNDEADSSFLLTSAIDHRDEVATFRLEAQRRVADGLIAEVEGTLFVNGDDDPLGSDLQDDSFVRFKLTYFW